jgi:hypothetical protein
MKILLFHWIFLDARLNLAIAKYIFPLLGEKIKAQRILPEPWTTEKGISRSDPEHTRREIRRSFGIFPRPCPGIQRRREWGKMLRISLPFEFIL